MRLTPLSLCLPLLALLGLTSPVRAEEPPQQQAKVDVTMDVRPTGAGDARVVLDFAPLTYQVVKGLIPDPSRYLMDLAVRRGGIELGSRTSARYDDATTSAQLDLEQLNAARNLGEGRWEIRVDPAFEYISDKLEGDRPTFFFYQFGTYERPGGDSMRFRGQFRYRLPAGATGAAWEADKHLIRYQLARPEGTGPGALTVDLEVKPRLMTGIYKVYGREESFAHMWLAKARLTNSGASVVRDVRVRYRLDGYSEWSPWERFAEAVPGQTLVSRYHPVLDAKIARLQAHTPAQILAEWTWTGLDGQPRTDGDGRKVTLLGGRDLSLYGATDAQASTRYVENVTNWPFVAAWVTPDDPAVKEFAAMASRVAQGEGAGRGDESTVEVLRAIYDLWVSNGFTYQHPPGLKDESVSFDEMFVQTVKYPRDVLRDKGGTCIDVAICYAAMAHALGIRPYLALRPGHCFPVFELPSGRLLAVEATGATKGGLKADEKDRGRVMPFPVAVKLAMQDKAEREEQGTLILVDVQTMWTRGVASPELEPLPANILKEWGLSTGARAAEPRPAPAPAPAPAPQPGGEAQGGDPYVGRWTMNLTETLAATGQTITYPVVLTIAPDGQGYKAGTEANAQVQAGGATVSLRVIQVLAGARTAEGALMLKGTQKVVQNLTTGQHMQMPVDTLVAVVRGGLLVGKGTSDGSNWLEFQMRRLP